MASLFPTSSPSTSYETAPLTRRSAVFLAVIACAASLALYALPIARPTLIMDDFQIVFRSWTWPKAWDNLWVPANEHAMPLGRITTCALAWAAGGRPTAFLSITGWHGPLALVAAMFLLGVFVARARGHAFYGLLAMSLFGVSTIYRDAVFWFSASFSIFALDTFLVALLAAQQAVHSGKRWPLALCFVGCALAPGWFAIGILAGPLCSAYLLAAACERNGDPVKGQFRVPSVVDLLWAALPTFGSLAFLAVSLPLTAETILHLPHYEEQTAIEAFHPLIGLEWTCRSIVDNLAWSFLGVSGWMCPRPFVWIPLFLIVVLAAWWVWQAPRKTLVILGLCMIAVSYWLMYSARANWGYDHNVQNWSRYHLFPQAGLAMLVAGGLRVPSARLQGSTILILIGVLFVLQLPRGILRYAGFSTEASNNEFTYQLPFGYHAYFAFAETHQDQWKVMRQIEEVDERCRKYHISAATAQRVLEPIRIPYDCVEPPRNESNWQFLHGSDDPHDISDEEAKRLLQGLAP